MSAANRAAPAAPPSPPSPPSPDRKFPRHGAWCKFDADIPGAFKTPDGLVLGIYQFGSAGSVVNGVATPTPEHVAVVRPDGTNLMRLGDDGQSLTKVAVAPADCPGLVEATVPDDLPKCDRNAHLWGE